MTMWYVAQVNMIQLQKKAPLGVAQIIFFLILTSIKNLNQRPVPKVRRRFFVLLLRELSYGSWIMFTWATYHIVMELLSLL